MKRYAIRVRWKWPQKLGLGLVVSALCLLALEGLLRLFLGAPPHPIMVRTMMGEYESYFTVQAGYVATTYQDSEPDGPCPPFPAATEEPRIAVLGASSVRTGIDVAIGDRFSELITDRTGVQTLNLGCSGADSHDLVRVLEQLLDWPMTLVVLYSGHCDVGNAFLLQRYSSLGGRATARLQPLLENSQLFVQYRRMLSPLSRTEPPGVKHEGLLPDEVAMIERGFERNLRRMVGLCRSHDVPLVMCVPASDLTYPPPGAVSDRGQRAHDAWEQGIALLPTEPDRAVQLLEEARDSSARPVRASAVVEEIIRRVAQDQDVSLVDARRDLPRDSSGAIPDPALFVDELHLSAAGHEALTDLLVPAILGELPPG